MWNHDRVVGTSHPVVDSGTRAEEPVDVHTDQGQTRYPPHDDEDELPHYSRSEETEDLGPYRPHHIQPRHPAEGVSPPTSRGTVNRKATYDPRTGPPALYDREVLGQYGTDILPYTRQCHGLPQYHIPRPSLKCTDSECSCRGSKSPDSSKTWPAGRTSMASSNSSSQSGSSGSLLLTAANLAALRCEPAQVGIAPEDNVSLASSTHFTVVNGVDRRKAKPLPTCCWHRHQLTALVLAMSTIFLIIILAAVLYVEMRWRDIHMFR